MDCFILVLQVSNQCCVEPAPRDYITAEVRLSANFFSSMLPDVVESNGASPLATIIPSNCIPVKLTLDSNDGLDKNW